MTTDNGNTSLVCYVYGTYIIYTYAVCIYAGGVAACHDGVVLQLIRTAEL